VADRWRKFTLIREGKIRVPLLTPYMLSYADSRQRRTGFGLSRYAAALIPGVDRGGSVGGLDHLPIKAPRYGALIRLADGLFQ
jgi:hypothetical protein